MDESGLVKEAYLRMCDAMIRKDMAMLADVLDESFTLIHMTGMRQSKQEFIRAVMNGTLNYYSAKHESMDAAVMEDYAVLDGKTMVSAAVFGGGRHTWRLRQVCRMKKREDGWKITESTASTIYRRGSPSL